MTKIQVNSQGKAYITNLGNALSAPNGRLNITENGTYTVTHFDSVYVNVKQSSTGIITLNHVDFDLTGGDVLDIDAVRIQQVNGHVIAWLIDTSNNMITTSGEDEIVFSFNNSSYVSDSEFHLEFYVVSYGSLYETIIITNL